MRQVANRLMPIEIQYSAGRTSPWRQAGCAIALAGLLACPGSLLAQTEPATQPSEPLLSTQTVLSQLESQSIEHQAEIRQDLIHLQQRLRLSLVRVQIPLSRAPTTRPLDPSFVPTGSDPAATPSQAPAPTGGANPVLVLTGLGVIVDDEGHLLVPEYVEPAKNSPSLKIFVDTEAGLVGATYIASDRPTRLSVFKLDAPYGKRAQTSTTPFPADGALVYVVPSNDPNAHLGFWNTGNAESGWVAGVNGQIYGLARQGRMFTLQHMTQIASQLVQYHSVRRAQLGVTITELPNDAPERRDNPRLGNRPAILVLEVINESPASQAGLHQGDLILTLNGVAVPDRFGFAAAIALSDGDTPFGIYRSGQEQTVHVMLHPTKR